MGRMFYENQGTRTYLVYEVEENEELDSMGIGMLTNNRIPGLAQTIFTQMDKKRYIKYDVTAKLTATDFFAGTVNRKRLLSVLQGMVNAMLSADDYMIDMRSILFDTDYIFMDVSTCATEMIALPIVNEEREAPDAGQFFNKFVFDISARLDQTESCDYAFKIISYLNVSAAFSLGGFKQLLDELAGVAGPAPGSTPGPAAGPAPGPTPGPASGPAPGPTPEPRKDVYGGNNMRRNDSQNQVRRQEDPRVTPVKPAMNEAGSRPQGDSSIGGGNTGGNIGGGSINIPGGKPGMAIPGRKGAAGTGSSQIETGAQPAGTEKEISLFYLLQHYNKENAAAYKAQKEAKEAQKQSQTPQKEPKKKDKTKKGKNQDTGYAIPGQADNQGPNNYGPNPNFVNAGGGNGTGNVPVNGGTNGYGMGNAPVNGGTNGYGMGNAPVNGGTNGYGTGNVPVNGGTDGYGMGNAPVKDRNGGNAGNFGGTVSLKPDGGSKPTTVLGKRNQSERPTPHLIRLRTQQRIMITSSPFKIGRDPKYADYCISDNDAVGRSHAIIIVNQSGCFVKDTNSTNHTFVNGQMIQSNQEVPLNDCDRVRFADEEFEFRMRG